MLVFGTEMHVVTLFFVTLELVMFGVQFGYYLNQPEDKPRFWYLLLLGLLIVYNVSGGLFPDSEITFISIRTQNIIAYGSGFLMASYFPFYFYMAFELKRLRFHAIYGVPLFLLLPYVVFFIISYSLNDNIDFAVKYGIIIPFFYSFIVLRAILIAIRVHYKENRNRRFYIEEIAVYCAVVPWVAMVPITYFHFSQAIEVLFTNLGFLFITGMFIFKATRRAKQEREMYAELEVIPIDQVAIDANCKRFALSPRENDVVNMICQRLRYKEIAEKLFISERTVNKHVQNIFNKVEVTTRSELVRKMNSF
ncbi:regulatory LuxR family protein [Mucilaginibacter gracilis]|uniref:Regulatory LuxR family protein n=1 Tax=Mucilaginibacter gracilis TaxID=423350 RepID=A0A495J404_9SPHI|nr:helix-turn-helix transcriptional regulator [Mucilaginibacter gracilis]RKR83411.1 regulatory LuxR family protein [Mucilaginibacter gracilis]